MNVVEIIKDSIKYPLSDWKKFLILGVLILFTFVYTLAESLDVKNLELLIFLYVAGFLINFFADGYSFRIIKLSLSGLGNLPEFDNWINMFKDGIKMFIVNFLYLIPAIFIVVFGVLFHLSALRTIIGFHPSNLTLDVLSTVGIWAFFVALYYIVVAPIIAMAKANMIYNNGEVGSAFRLREILDKITSKGWLKLIKWYLATMFTGLILVFLMVFVLTFLLIFIGYYLPSLNLIHNRIVEAVIFPLILMPYLLMYTSRSIALFYVS